MTFLAPRRRSLDTMSLPLAKHPLGHAPRLRCLSTTLVPLLALNLLFLLALSGHRYACRSSAPALARLRADAAARISRPKTFPAPASASRPVTSPPLRASDARPVTSPPLRASDAQPVTSPGLGGGAPPPPPERLYPAVPACATRGGARSRAKSWLMVFMGHSGSTAIVSELSKHSRVFFELPEPVDHGAFAENSTAALAYARDFFSRGVAAGRTPGFKIRPRHLLAEKDAWARLLDEFGTRVIWQFRENVFKQSVGEYSHRYLNDTSVVEGLRPGVSREERCKTGAGCRFRVDNFDFFHELLRDSVRSDAQIADAVEAASGGGKVDDCTLAMPYEAYLYDRAAAMGRLHDFLGLAREDHPPDRRKATSDSLCDAVENYADLCREFYGCHTWRAMMDDFGKNKCHCAMFSTRAGKTSRCATH